MSLYSYPEDYIPSHIDENLNLGEDLINIEDAYNILLCAKSWSGKGFII